MADTKISALTAVTSVVAAQEFAVNDAAVSKKASAAQVKTFINPLTFLGRTQLGADAEDISVSFTAQDGVFLIIVHIAGCSGAGAIAKLRPNNDTGANYSSTASEPADAAATSTVNATGLILGEAAQTVARSPVVCWVNKPSSGQIAFLKAQGGDGSITPGTAITTINSVALWNNTVAQISSFTLNSGTAGINLLSGSYVEVYGVKNA